MPSISKDLVKAKALAVQQVIDRINMYTVPFKATFVEGEPDSFAEKQTAALAHRNGSASPEQIALLQAEINITGETLDQLATSILTSAPATKALIGAASGLRRKHRDAVNAAASIAEVNVALNAAATEIDAILGATT